MPSQPTPGDQRFLADLRDGLEKGWSVRPLRLLIAISGGADSTALLLGLHELASKAENSQEIQAAHFNHQLRGGNSTADERFCRDLCDRLNIKIHTGTADVAAHAAGTGHSVESAARDLRYRFLAKTVSENGLDAVATGHTADDQAETVLLAMTRGAGLRGMSGMAYVTSRHDLQVSGKPLQVLRPMLGMRRVDTEGFCATNSVTPRNDASNTDLAYARNRMRHNVVPELQKINPGVVDAITRLASITSEDIQLIDELAENALAEATVDKSSGASKTALRKMTPALRTHVIAAAYRMATGTMRDIEMVALVSVVEAVTELDSGSIDLPNGAKLVIEHDVVRFLVGGAEPECPYPTSVGEHDLHLLRTLRFKGGETLSARIVWPAPDPSSLTRWQTIISPEVVSDQLLRVRSRRDGDRFHALGMDAEMKLQDFFVNRHVPARWRSRVPLVLTDRGICWVVGERVADWAKVPEGANEAVLLEYASAE